MVRFSLSPSISGGGIRLTSSYRDNSALPFIYSSDESSTSVSSSDESVSGEMESEEEPAHPLGFDSPSCVHSNFSTTRFNFFDDSDSEEESNETENKRNPLQLRPHHHHHLPVVVQLQSYPSMSCYTHAHTAPTASLVRYNHSLPQQQKHGQQDDEIDSITQLLRAASMVDHHTPATNPATPVPAPDDVGQKMRALTLAARRELRLIVQQSQDERLVFSQEHQRSTDTLKTVLQRDQDDARKVIGIEQKQQQALRIEQKQLEQKQKQLEIEEKAASEKFYEEQQQQQRDKETHERQAQEREQIIEQKRKDKKQAVQERQAQELAQKTEYITKAQKLITKLVDLRASVEPFEKSKVPHVSKRRLQMKKTVRGKINTLSLDAGKVQAVAAEVSAVIREARAHDEHIKTELQNGNGEFTSEMSRGKRYLLDLLASNVIVRVQAESFNGPRGDGFPLAAMLCAISTEAKDFVPILAAHIYTVCPTVIPQLPKPSPDATETELMESLGMQRNKNGEFETFERFLARTAGIVSMVAEIMSCKPSNHSLLGGHQGAVNWLQRFLAVLPEAPQKPLPLITAPVLDAFLTGAGHMLAHKYPEQFQKQLDIIMNDTVNRLDEGTIGQPSAARLKTLVEGGLASFKNKLAPGAVPELYDGSEISSQPNGSHESQVVNSKSSFKTTAPFANNIQAAAPNPFGAATQNQTPSNAFGGVQQNAQEMNGMSTPFGQSNEQSMDSSAPTNQNPFGQSASSAPSAFGQTSDSFGNSMNGSNMNTNAFGGENTNTTASNAFGGSGSSMNMASTPFSGGTESAPNNAFGNTASATPFGVTGANSNPFGANTNSGFGGASNGAQAQQFGGASGGRTPFGSNTQSTTPFGGDQQSQQSTPFGGAQQSQQSTPFGGSSFGGGEGRKDTRPPCRFFAQGTCRSGDNCKFSHETPGGGGGGGGSSGSGGTFGGGGGNGNGNSGTFGGGGGKKDSKPPCRFFAQGTCRNGNNCKFSHDTGGSSSNAFGGAASNGSGGGSGNNPFGGPRR